MSKRSRKSKRKLNSLLWMLLLTAILVVSSTYAWFSANTVVTISNIHAKVSAAEGLQVSLDGEKWGANLDLSVANGETVPGALSALDGINNYTWPLELRPVSTDGHHANSGDVIFYAGDVSADGSYLTGPATDTTNYISFDLYFKNASSQVESGDVLQLNTGTLLNITDSSLAGLTGLEYSARVGMLIYDSQEAMTADAADVRDLAAGTSPKTVIWEPNYNSHIAEVIANDNRISALYTVSETTGLPERNANPDFVTLGLKSITTTTISDVTAVHGINALTADGNANLQAQKTMQTSNRIQSPTPLQGVTFATADGAGESSELSTIYLPANSIVKTRVYIWLEGQDPDCNDTASTGQALDFVLSFTKPSVTPASGS